MIASLPLLLMAVQAVLPQGARVHRVAPGTPALREVVASAAAGDTLLFETGQHAGLLLIDRRLTLMGEPGARLDGGRRGTVITVRADSVRIEGLAITGSGRSLVALRDTAGRLRPTSVDCPASSRGIRWAERPATRAG